MTTFGFSKRDAKRISNVVQEVEGRPRKKPPNRRSITSQHPTGLGMARRARITGAATLGPNRWRYEGDEIGSVDSSDVYILASGGMQWRIADNTYLLNDIEAANDGAGVEGHGVDVDGIDYPAGFAVVPIGIGAIVTVRPLPISGGGTRWTFSVPNTDDGTCNGS